MVCIRKSKASRRSAYQALFDRPKALWAATILSSRSFISSLLSLDSLEADEKDWRKMMGIDADFPVLLPLVDLINHDVSAQVTWERSSSALHFVLGQNLKRGEHVWNNYGNKGNEERKLMHVLSSTAPTHSL